MKLPSNEEPIYRVDPRGIIEPIGSYLPRERRLVLDREGYPLLAPGEHAIDDEDLPWVLQDTAPTGFIGQRFAQWFSALRLPQRPRDWSALDALRAVCEAGPRRSGTVFNSSRDRDNPASLLRAPLLVGRARLREPQRSSRRSIEHRPCRSCGHGSSRRGISPGYPGFLNY